MFKTDGANIKRNILSKNNGVHFELGLIIQFC